MPKPDGSLLDPLPPEALDGEKYETTLTYPKCNHQLQIVNSSEVKCKVCGVGWTGHGVYKLLKLFGQTLQTTK